MEIKNITVKDWFDAFKQKDINMLHLHENFSHTSPFGTIDGREAYLDLVRANQEKFFTDDIQIVDAIEREDTCFVRYVVNGMDACDCIYLEDNQIKAIYSYYHFGDKPQL